jgi:hypothetical protein
VEAVPLAWMMSASSAYCGSLTHHSVKSARLIPTYSHPHQQLECFTLSNSPGSSPVALFKVLPLGAEEIGEL